MAVQAVLVGIRDIAGGTLQRLCQETSGGQDEQAVPGSSTDFPGNGKSYEA